MLTIQYIVESRNLQRQIPILTRTRKQMGRTFREEDSEDNKVNENHRFTNKINFWSKNFKELKHYWAWNKTIGV